MSKGLAMDSLIDDIKILLKIDGGMFINMAIEDYLANIEPADYRDFFNALSGDEFAYKTGMDRVAIVSSSFNERKRALINRNVPTKANELANKLFSLKTQVCDNYKNIKYDAIKLDNERFFNNKEIMVINNLDMDALMKVIDTQSFSLTVDKINSVMEKINQASAEGMALSLNDKKLLR